MTVLDPDGIDGNADDSDGYVDGVDGTISCYPNKESKQWCCSYSTQLMLQTDYKNKQIKESPLVTLAFFMTNKYVHVQTNKSTSPNYPRL